MNCPTQNILSAYVDQELPDDQVRDVVDHLAQCPRCQEWVNQAQFIGSVVRNASTPVPTDAMMARWSRVKVATSDKSVRRLAGWLTAAASLALAWTTVINMSNHAEGSTSFTELNAAIGVTEDESSSSSIDETARWIATDLSLQSGKTAGGQLP